MTSKRPRGRPLRVLSPGLIQEAITLIGSGVPPPRALRRLGIGPDPWRRHIKVNPALREQLKHARRWGLRSRLGWSIPALEACFDEVRTTATSMTDALARHGLPAGASGSGFYHMIEREGDAWLRNRYDSAKNVQQRRLTEGLRAGTHALLNNAGSRGEVRKVVRGFNRASLAIRRLMQKPQRKSETIAYRAAQDAADPVGAPLRAARRRAKKEANRVVAK